MRLPSKHEAEAIRAKIEQFDHEMTQPVPPKRPAGYLVKSIKDNYNPDKSFISEADRKQQKEAKEAKDREAEAKRQLKARLKATEEGIEKLIQETWDAKTPEQKAWIETLALSGASEADKQAYHKMSPPSMQRTFLNRLRKDFMRKQEEESV